MMKVDKAHIHSLGYIRNFVKKKLKRDLRKDEGLHVNFRGDVFVLRKIGRIKGWGDRTAFRVKSLTWPAGSKKK